MRSTQARGVADGHGVYPAAHEPYVREILSEVEAGPSVSQRVLSRRIGIALGLTNLLVKRLVRKGWVRMVRIKPNRVVYLLTPAGMAAKARLSCAYFAHSTRFYAEARDRIRSRFEDLSTSWSTGPGSDGKPIVFLGAGEVGEIGYVCLQETDLTLVAVVDAHRTRPFFGMPVNGLSTVPEILSAMPSARVVVMSFEDRVTMRQSIVRQGVSDEKLYWI